MLCPFCQASDTKVIDSRLIDDGTQVRRRRECLTCNERFTTFETVELVLPQIIKRDNRREPFNEAKLRGGIMQALQKRPISSEQVEQTLVDIKRKLRAAGEREVSSQLLGQWMMDALQQLDEVAYVRFASVYRAFQDVNAFGEEIKRLQQAHDQNTQEIN